MSPQWTYLGGDPHRSVDERFLVLASDDAVDCGPDGHGTKVAWVSPGQPALARIRVLRADGAYHWAALTCPRSPGQHLGVLFCDVDHFKSINDTWGHTTGDAVLATVADRIRECLRAGDTVGRVGGDEMVALLPGLHDIDEAARIAEKIRFRAAEPIHHAGNSIHTTLSIGATLVRPGESVEAITTRADEAMYEAKRTGRNMVTKI